MTTYTPHVHQWKKDEVAELQRLFKEYKIAGVVDLSTLPSAHLQKIKKQLRGTMLLKITRKRFILKALEALKLLNGEQLTKAFADAHVPAALFTNEDPFLLYKKLQKNKSSAAAKAGQVAPFDLVIPAGPTNFTPGPMIGELGQLGIKTEVKEGKIGIREDKVLVKNGEVISPKAAGLLQKLGIEPMQLGLNLVLTYQKGEILPKEVLGVDEQEYIAHIQQAANEARNLAVVARYFTQEVVELLIQRASREAKAVAKEGKILTAETAGEILALAEAQAAQVQQAAGV